MTARGLRQKYFDFFKTKGHAWIPSYSLIPENDPSVLFTNAGMHPLVPYLMGEKHPKGTRIVNAQKCIRTIDIDEVGDFTHHTFFEMLGNWSLGDYFKKESIKWSWEFLTSPDWLGLDKKRLAVSVFKGDEVAGFDEESFETWKDLGLEEKKIAKLDRDANWWELGGGTGPCGPDTEIFYWVGGLDKVPDSFNDDNDLWVEIWNNVFMEFYKNEEGKYEPLSNKNVDTGMGLERVLAIINGLDDNYKSELFKNVIKKIEYISARKYDESEEIRKSMRIIADHIKTATFIMGDIIGNDFGIKPSNVDQGYIVRRLIRRAIRHGKQIGMELEKWTSEIAKVVADDYKDIYPEINKNLNSVINNLEEEEEKFSKTLENGLKQLEKLNQEAIKKSEKFIITGREAFDLYQTYGFPKEMTKEEIERVGGLLINSDEFEEELKKHQELSRTATVGKFKGGLADTGDETKKLHTAAHLLLASLRKVLGDHVAQKGSNITPERLRFDFSHNEKMTEEEKEKVENLVNKAILDDLPINCKELSIDEAKESGAIATFEDRYDDKVKVYSVGQGDDLFSYEICGGPHVDRTGELDHFRIKKEQSSSAGVRRIKAVLE
ncbi:alanine--tRNA ligase [bacterium]|nr:alanine--tRNA ligase [bacterium]